jgi:hypothetical protein
MDGLGLVVDRVVVNPVHDVRLAFFGGVWRVGRAGCAMLFKADGVDG